MHKQQHTQFLQQATNHILMVRPAAFSFNPETAKDNAFQDKKKPEPHTQIQTKALSEFDRMVGKLSAAGLSLTVVQDTSPPEKPDAIFPNNWFTTHANGNLVTYPLLSKNRRCERSIEALSLLRKSFKIVEEIDLSGLEADAVYLEGTGSMVLDRENKYCYAALSERTHLPALQKFGTLLGYDIFTFPTSGPKNKPIYHTNVMLSVATHFAVVCLSCVADAEARQMLRQKIEASGKAVIEISEAQLGAFCGNVLEVKNQDGQLILVMSERAYRAFTTAQKRTITQTNEILHTNIDTIETFGGGGTRCMMAEIFLPPSSV